MPLYSTEAVVLRKIDYRESDQIMTFLTPDYGRISGLVRGAKRIRSRFGAALEMLTYGRLIYFDRQGKNLVSINHFDILKSFQRIREDLIRSASCQYMAELIMGLIPERESATEVFKLLVRSMEGMSATRDPDAVLRIFEIKFLSLIGFSPRMDACVFCGSSKGHFGFSIKDGGLVCSSCRGRAAETDPVPEGILFFWKQASAMDLTKMDRVRLQRRLNTGLKWLLHRYFLHLFGREIRSFIFLENLGKETGCLTPAAEDGK